MKKVIAECEKRNIVPAVLGWAGATKMLLDLGFRMLIGAADVGMIAMGTKQAYEEFKSHL